MKLGALLARPGVLYADLREVDESIPDCGMMLRSRLKQISGMRVY